MNDTFKALSNPTRREIIAALREGPMASGDIARLFDMSWPTITGHLAVLKDAGLIEAERAGTSVRYRLVSGAFEDALAFLLDLAGAGRPVRGRPRPGNREHHEKRGIIGRPAGQGVYALFAAQVGLAAYIALYGPQGPLPMHFDMHGNVDRWGSRLEAAGVLLGFAVLTLGLESMMKRVLARADVAAGTRKSLVAARVCTALGFAFVTALLVALGLGRCSRERTALDRPLGAGAGMGGSPGRGRLARQGRAQSLGRAARLLDAAQPPGLGAGQPHARPHLFPGQPDRTGALAHRG